MDFDDFLNFKELDNEIQSMLDQSEYQHHLKIQLEEIDVLRAMYYKDKEFIIDGEVLNLVNEFVKDETTEVPPDIDFTVNLSVDKFLIEIQVVLPKLYPTTEPIIFIRNRELSRHQMEQFNSDLRTFLSSIDRGIICVLESILWISNNVHHYTSEISQLPAKSDSKKLFSRFWIYSHHIYSNDKRRFMLSLSKQNNITGFCLAGKPGMICIEGWNSDCDEWWQKVRNLTWKKIICIEKEEIKISENEYEVSRKFQDFTEISFQSGRNSRTGTHTDMGEYYKYLVEHDCGHVFKKFFGFEGKTPAGS